MPRLTAGSPPFTWPSPGSTCSTTVSTGERVSQSPNDKLELVPTLAVVPAEAGLAAAALEDTGFFREKAVRQIERTEPGVPMGSLDYAAVEKSGPHRSVADLEVKSEPESPAPEASAPSSLEPASRFSMAAPSYS
jgi:hypothetical protein